MSGQSVRQSARPSVKRVNCDKTKETSAQILLSHEKAMHLVLRQEEWLVRDDPSTCNFGPNISDI